MSRLSRERRRKQSNPRVCCDRVKLVETDYLRVTRAQDGRRALVVYTDRSSNADRYGMSHTLTEIAARAIIDGNLVLDMLGKNGTVPKTLPSTRWLI